MTTEDKMPLNREQRRAKSENLSHWKVLIVDDQKDNLAVAEMVLKFHEAEVHIARNGIEGLEALKTFPATLILLDLSMPEMNGWDMFKAMKADESQAKIAVIALTAHVMAGDEEKVMAAGFDGYIAKPFSVTTIIQQIKTIVDSIKD